MIEEILPGLLTWSVYHDGIGHMVHSAFETSSGTLIDPMEPQEGLQALSALGIPQRIVLTNRHHYRHSARYVERFGCPVLCHEAGTDHFDASHPVHGFRFDERLAQDVRALELGSICAEETTVLLDIASGALCFGDGVTREADGPLTFMPDQLLGDDPHGVRDGLMRNLRRICEEDFDTLLFAHADPVIVGGRKLLGDFLQG